MKRLSAGIACGALFFATGTGIAGAPSGNFIVVEARRDPAVRNGQAQYRVNDPQLVNRFVTFSASAVSIDGTYACAPASMRTGNITAGKLFKDIIYPRTILGDRRFARPVDFGLRMSPQTIIPVTHFHCGTFVSHDGRDWNRAALFAIGKNTYALYLIQDFLLILKPAPSRVTASFDCAKAVSPVERTICSDPVLAGWDRSVKRAYDDTSGDLGEQRAWLAQRDKCGTNRACLQGAMSLRVNNLLS